MQGGCRSRAETLCGTVIGRNWIVASRRTSENDAPGQDGGRLSVAAPGLAQLRGIGLRRR